MWQKLRSFLTGEYPLLIFLIIYTLIVFSLGLRGSHHTAYLGTDDISFASGWTDSHGKTVNPGKLDTLAEQSDTSAFTLTNTLPALETDSYLSFYSYGAYFSISIDGDTIYTYDYEPIYTAGHSYGTDFHNVLIPREASGKTISFSIHLIYESSASFLDMVLGKSSEFIIRYLRRMLPAFIISLVTIVFGLLILTVARSLSEDEKMLRGLYAFAAISIGMGLWALIETQILTLIYGHAEIFRSYDYLILMVIPYPVAIVLNGWVEKSNKTFEKTVKWMVIANIFLTFFMRRVFDKDLHQLHLLIHAVLLFTIVSVVFLAVQNIIYKNKHHIIHSYIRLWIGILILTACAVIDLFRYNVTNKSNIDAAQYTRIGFLCLMYFLLSQYMIEARIRIQKSIESETYRQLAYRDELTGAGTRAAFEQKEAELNGKLRKELTIITIVSADVNYLKKINDTYGHAAGDTYLIACADLLRNAFEEFGSVFRVGGDEFTIFIEGKNSPDIYRTRLEFMAKSLSDYPYGTDQFPIKPSLAIGSEIICSSDGRDLETAEKIADTRMYENKLSMKAARSD